MVKMSDSKISDSTLDMLESSYNETIRKHQKWCITLQEMLDAGIRDGTILKDTAKFINTELAIKDAEKIITTAKIALEHIKTERKLFKTGGYNRKKRTLRNKRKHRKTYRK